MTLAQILTGILVYGVATLWVRERWACTSLETAIFLCTACMLLRRRSAAGAVVPGLVAVMGFWGIGQAAAGWSVVPADTADAALYWLSAACLAWLGMEACTLREPRRAFLKTLLAAGATICLLGVVQLFTSSGRIFWLFPSGYESGVIGPFVSRNHYAAFVEVLLPMALVLAFRPGRRARVFLVIAAALVASVVASGSRAGSAIVAAEALLAFLLQVRTRRGGMGRKLAAFAVLVSAFSLIVGYQYLWQRFTGERDPLEFRREFVQSSMAMVRDQPLHGLGLGTWPAAYRQYALLDTGLAVEHAHNEWVQWAAEGGLPALVLMLALAAISLPSALRSIWGLGVPAVFLHSIVDYPFLRLGLAAWIFVLMGALAAYGRERRHATSGVPGPLMRGLCLAAVPVLAIAMFQACRTGWADSLYRRATPDGIARAARLRPDRAEYQFALADAGAAIPHLRRALELNPFLTNARILLASKLEAQGQLADSEAALLESAQRDRQYLPAWALANFYFRAGRLELFWQWARTASRISPAGMAPLFDLCFAVTSSPEIVWKRVVESRPLAEREYLTYLVDAGMGGAYEAALGIVSRAGPEDRDTLLAYVDRALETGEVESAAEIWNRLCRRRLAPYPPVARGELVNGEFSHAISNRGFDWRNGAADCALAAVTHSDGDALELFLSGRRPENCEMFSQFLRLDAGTRYVLRFQYRTGDLPEPTGLHWSLGSEKEYELRASQEWADGAWRWRAADATSRLAFLYRRPWGSIRREGTVLLRHVRIEREVED